jgi:Family of unknown function (DUF6328)
VTDRFTGRPGSDQPDDGWNEQARGETREQRLDRNFDELLQELRVAQTGVQFLFAFLLTIPFSARFPETTSFQRWLYLFVLVCTGMATGLLIGPVSFHRLVFRQHRKGTLVQASDRMAIGGIACLLVAIVGSVLLVSDVILEALPAAYVAAGVAGWLLIFWYVIPLAVRRRPAAPGSEGGSPGGVTGMASDRGLEDDGRRVAPQTGQHDSASEPPAQGGPGTG